MLDSRPGGNGNECCAQQRHQQRLSHGEQKKVTLPPESYTIDMQSLVTLMHELQSVDQYVR